LKRLASQRTDVFDAGVAATSSAPAEGHGRRADGGNPDADTAEGARRKRVALGLGGAGEGVGGVGAGVAKGTGLGEGISIEEQIRVIHQKAKQ